MSDRASRVAGDGYRGAPTENACKADGRTAFGSLAARAYRRASASQPIKASLALLLVGFISLDTVLILGRFAGVRPVMWFPDTPWILITFGGFMLTVAAIWDGFLLLLDTAGAVWTRWRIAGRAGHRWASTWRRWGFFSVGIWPFPLFVVAIYFLTGTSNISNISLKLLQSVTTWHDAFFWELEGPFLSWATSSAIDVKFWETVYTSGWHAEMLALFIVIVVSRSPLRTACFCMSFVLLFYLGRLIGLASPVMGPAFFRPEEFAHLQGSMTVATMRMVLATMTAGPDAIEQGALLLGGVAAMPSLHVGMISLAGYWLAATVRWTTVLVVPWLLCVWTSTVLLGWHYALDGLGGIAVAALCVALTYRILALMKVGEEDGGTQRAEGAPSSP